MIKNSNSKIEKLRNKIKNEKIKLKKNKQSKEKKFLKTKFGVFLNKIFLINNKNKKVSSNFFDGVFYGFVYLQQHT